MTLQLGYKHLRSLELDVWNLLGFMASVTVYTKVDNRLSGGERVSIWLLRVL